MINKPRTASTASDPHPAAVDERSPGNGIADGIIAERRRRLGAGWPR
jgi:hypothetical protein